MINPLSICFRYFFACITINEENKLRGKVKALTEREDEVQKMKSEHEQEMKLMNEKMNLILEMIQENPELAKVKPEALTRKKKM